MAPQSDFDVILIGSWEPVSGQASPVRVGAALIWFPGTDLHSLRDLATEVRPAWLLLGSVADDDDLLMRMVATVRGAAPGVRVAVLGLAADIDRCERWLRGGVLVYLDPASTPERVAGVMRAAMDHDIMAADGGVFRAALLRRAELQGNLVAMGGLSPVESDILQLIQHGATNADIAAMLHLSQNTVEFHVRNVLNKLGVRNRTQAAESGAG